MQRSETPVTYLECLGYNSLSCRPSSSRTAPNMNIYEYHLWQTAKATLRCWRIRERCSMKSLPGRSPLRRLRNLKPSWPGGGIYGPRDSVCDSVGKWSFFLRLGRLISIPSRPLSRKRLQPILLLLKTPILPRPLSRNMLQTVWNFGPNAITWPMMISRATIKLLSTLRIKFLKPGMKYLRSSTLCVSL